MSIYFLTDFKPQSEKQFDLSGMPDSLLQSQEQIFFDDM